MSADSDNDPDNMQFKVVARRQGNLTGNMVALQNPAHYSRRTEIFGLL